MADRAAATVGILGGMGPAATVDLMQRIIDLTPARDDQDHLHLLVDNNPQVPSRIAALIDGDGPSPVPTLQAMAQGLERAGATVLAMPCNTAHHYHGAIAGAVEIPLLDLRSIVAARLGAEDGVLRVGLLASTALQRIELYEPFLEQQGLEAIYPPEELQHHLMLLIRAVKATSHAEPGHEALGSAAQALLDEDVDALLIACTELSALGPRLNVAVPVFDAADLLARAVVTHAGP